MKSYTQPDPTVLVIFGAAGDLTWRKLVPALYTLHAEGWLPEKLAVVGMDLKRMSDDRWRDRLRDGVDRFARVGKSKGEPWKAFASQCHYRQGDVSSSDTFKDLAKYLKQVDKDWGTTANKAFYLAVQPSLILEIAEGLSGATLARGDASVRIVVEKPFGHDYASAVGLNNRLVELFDESQIYRIDHYLGKETVQNILAFRFANSYYEPVWNRRYIDHVQISVAEELGVGHRGAYYEEAGALRDMIQNHLSQVLCLVAMEPPVSYEADEIRNKKADVLRSIRPIPGDRVHEYAVRGQYAAGWLHGDCVKGYRQEDDVSPDSSTETFAAIKLFVDNWRWQDVPFFLRTGKRMPVRRSEVTIQFRTPPHQSFPSSAIMKPQPNRLVLRIQPHEGIVQQFQAKQPHEVMRLAPVEMRFFYNESFKSEPPEAYETLLLDVMVGDPTQFMRADLLEESWRIITPILETWQSVTPLDFPNYEAGTWGPEDARELIARDGHAWCEPEVHPGQMPNLCDAGEEEDGEEESDGPSGSSKSKGGGKPKSRKSSKKKAGGRKSG